MEKFVVAPEIDCVRGNSNGWMVMVAQGRGGQRLRIRPAKLLGTRKILFCGFFPQPPFLLSFFGKMIFC